MKTCMIGGAIYIPVDERNCPYFNDKNGICAASLSRMAIDSNRRAGHCSTEDYDNCPIFLARTLRKRHYELRMMDIELRKGN